MEGSIGRETEWVWRSYLKERLDEWCMMDGWMEWLMNEWMGWLMGDGVVDEWMDGVVDG